MFYSETLLQKTGPLAKVWLAANVERKLSKGDCLKTNIEKDVRNIVNTDQAPLALRLTSQLLLGVVRIYSRKARYLLDDCNEALVKIKMAFLPGNVDLPAHQSHIANPAALTLPDTITELDLFAQMPGPDELLFGLDNDTTLANSQIPLNWGTSQVLPASFTQPDDQDNLLLDDDIDLELEYEAPTDIQNDRSIEAGRRAEVPQPDRLDDTTMLHVMDDNITDFQVPMMDDDVPMHDMPPQSPAKTVENPFATDMDDAATRRRGSMTPLSELAPEEEQDLERTFQLDRQPSQDTEDAQAQAQQRVKRRKILQNDTNTELNNSQLRAQQDDRTKILKEPSFLPRDPVLSALMHMQRTGGFVSNILGDGRTLGWAPELRGVLSIDIVRRAGELKRKRDGQLPRMHQPEEPLQDDQVTERAQTPSVQAALDDVNAPSELDIQDEMPAPIDDFAMPLDDANLDVNDNPGAAFDETTVPGVHPADSGPVSLATKHAVHMLREHFGVDGEASTSVTRTQQTLLFTELCPEARTTRQDATKLFFETLVLGTKDAIKVEQASEELGGAIRIRAKRGLWGSWAETGVSQNLMGSQAVGLEEVAA